MGKTVAVATNDGDRLRQLERDFSEFRGEHSHVATKADVAVVKADTTEEKGELRLLKRLCGIQVAATIAFGTAILNFICGLTGRNPERRNRQSGNCRYTIDAPMSKS